MAHHPLTLCRPPRPQESISDFYWYYSGKDVIEEQGKRNFSKAMSVAKQVFNSLTEYIQVGPAGCWGRAGKSAPRRAAPSRSPPPAGPLHREPAEPGAQPPLGRRGGIPARVRPHDDEASSGAGPSAFPLPASGHPHGPFPSPAPPKCSRHVPGGFPPRGSIHPPSGLALGLTPPLPLPPIGWFPIHTSIGLTFGPAPSGRSSSRIGWCSFLSDEGIHSNSPPESGTRRLLDEGLGLEECFCFFTLSCGT